MYQNSVSIIWKSWTYLKNSMSHSCEVQHWKCDIHVYLSISDTPPPTPLPSLVSCDGSAPIGIGLSCYYISGLDTKTWPEASYVCEKKGMELASFHSVAEMNVIIQKFQNYQPQPGEQAPRFPENIWIGMTKGFSGKEQEYPTKSSIKCT